MTSTVAEVIRKVKGAPSVRGDFAKGMVGAEHKGVI